MSIDIDGFAGSLILALPLVLLAAVIFWATRRRPARPKTAPPPDAAVASSPPPALAGEPAAARPADPANHLATARARLARGDTAGAAGDLRQCIKQAQSVGHKEVEALARLDLGDIARDGGDLTSACEHWQMARTLFQGLSHAAGLKESETRMRAMGCPTDWVLNDF